MSLQQPIPQQSKNVAALTASLQRTPDTINRGLSFIIYADPGIGKTTMAATLPAESTLIINTEAGLGPLLGTAHNVFNLITATQNADLEKVVAQLYLTLRTELHPWRNIVLDNVSELEQQLILSLTKKRGKEAPELKEYGESSYKMKEWMHNFRDLIYNNINVVFNAWETPIEIKNNDGQIITKTFPMVGKKLAPQLCGLVDVVGHLEVHKSGTRWLRIGNHEQYITKCQFKGLDPTGEVADFPTIINKLMSYNYKQGEGNGNS